MSEKRLTAAMYTQFAYPKCCLIDKVSFIVDYNDFTNIRYNSNVIKQSGSPGIINYF